MVLDVIKGKWHIYATNFPMWLKGDKTKPSLEYTIENHQNGFRLLDVVSYIYKGNSKMIVGYDFSLNMENNSFVWRGKGLLYFLKSKWKIIEISVEHDWMVIFFEKTIFTPKGYDVVTRDENPSERIKKEIIDYLHKKQFFPPLKTLI